MRLHEVTDFINVCVCVCVWGGGQLGDTNGYKRYICVQTKIFTVFLCYVLWGNNSSDATEQNMFARND